MRTRVITTTVLVALTAPAAAQAHVTLQPKEAPAGGFARLDVRVPNEEQDKDTTKVEVKMPPGFAEASYEPVAGWTVKVHKARLAQPIKTDDGTVTEGVSEITWTADTAAAAIKPGQFRDFGLSVGLPEGKPGTQLTFKALQTYTGGEVVRWIGPPDAEKPAPRVTLTKAADEATTGASAAPAASEDADDGGPSTGLVTVALVLGAVGTLAGGVALARGARSPVR